MLLPSDRIADRLAVDRSTEKDPLVIAPTPDLEQLRKRGGASVDLRLGTWFMAMKARRHSVLDIYEKKESAPTVNDLTNRYYVPFSGKFILHPRSFVLAVTLEWLRIPQSLAGMVTGKSSWGRRGLIIETAPGIHPGFTGCLTLELSNVGEVPIAIRPGTEICQLFLHRLDESAPEIPPTQFRGQRQPILSLASPDEFARRLVREP
jgi:dCTP deaminase